MNDDQEVLDSETQVINKKKQRNVNDSHDINKTLSDTLYNFLRYICKIYLYTYKRQRKKFYCL